MYYSNHNHLAATSYIYRSYSIHYYCATAATSDTSCDIFIDLYIYIYAVCINVLVVLDVQGIAIFPRHTLFSPLLLYLSCHQHLPYVQASLQLRRLAYIYYLKYSNASDQNSTGKRKENVCKKRREDADTAPPDPPDAADGASRPMRVDDITSLFLLPFMLLPFPLEDEDEANSKSNCCFSCSAFFNRSASIEVLISWQRIERLWSLW